MTSASASCWAVLPAAGIGARMGTELPKQYLQVAGATLLEHSLRALLASDRVSGVVVVLHAQDERAAEIDLLRDARVTCTVGGARRSDSVLAGLSALGARADTNDWVLVHDAARPCLQRLDLERLINTVWDTGVGGILAEAIVDTVKLADANGRIQRTLDRDLLWRAQTPQMFRLAALQQALEHATEQGLAVTDEASVMELAGESVQLVPGSSRNLKVTVPADLALAGWYLEHRADENAP
jgi:2-C-methyl-D-erythritol 4-phosphate cytidylyltransferase